MDTPPRDERKPGFQSFLQAKNARIKAGTKLPGLDMYPGQPKTLGKPISEPHQRNSSFCASSRSSSTRRSTLQISTSDEDWKIPQGFDLSLSSASSLYSTASQKLAAKERNRMRSGELRRIREESKAMQTQVRERVEEIRSEAVRTVRPDVHLERELEECEVGLRRIVKAIEVLLLVSQLKHAYDKASSDLSSASTHNEPPRLQNTSANETIDQLTEMKTEIDELKQRFFLQDLEREQAENQQKELEAQVKTLKANLQVWEEADELRTGSENVRKKYTPKAGICTAGCMLF